MHQSMAFDPSPFFLVMKEEHALHSVRFLAIPSSSYYHGLMNDYHDYCDSHSLFLSSCYHQSCQHSNYTFQSQLEVALLISLTSFLRTVFSNLFKNKIPNPLIIVRNLSQAEHLSLTISPKVLQSFLLQLLVKAYHQCLILYLTYAHKNACCSQPHHDGKNQEITKFKLSILNYFGKYLNAALKELSFKKLCDL